MAAAASMALVSAKKGLRQTIRSSVSKVSAESLNEQTQTVLSALFALPEYQSAQNISVYLSMPSGEISTSSIVQDALDGRKTVYVPFIHKNVASATPDAPKSLMDMVTLRSLADYQALPLDRWGIPTPTSDSLAGRRSCLSDLDTSPTGVLDLIVMPGMAFDEKLSRLGHGRGYYDFFLERYHRRLSSRSDPQRKMPMLVGLALQEQVLPSDQRVPTNATDWQLDALLVGDGRLLRAAP